MESGNDVEGNSGRQQAVATVTASSSTNDVDNDDEEAKKIDSNQTEIRIYIVRVFYAMVFRFRATEILIRSARNDS